MTGESGDPMSILLCVKSQRKQISLPRAFFAIKKALVRGEFLG